MSDLPIRLFSHASGLYIDTAPRDFHGYTVRADGIIIGKKGKILKQEKRFRRNNSGFDWCVRLYYKGKKKKWTVSRLMAACFLGNIDGMEIDHIDGNPQNNKITNLEIVTSAENQARKWRKINENI